MARSSRTQRQAPETSDLFVLELPGTETRVRMVLEHQSGEAPVTRGHANKSGFLLNIHVYMRFKNAADQHTVIRDVKILTCTPFIDRDFFFSDGAHDHIDLSSACNISNISSPHRPLVFDAIASYARRTSDHPVNRNRHVIIFHIAFWSVRYFVDNGHGYLRLPVGNEVPAFRALKRMRVEEGSPASDEQCSICITKLYSRMEVVRLPCSHLFHHDCLVEWVGRKSDCPLCRRPLDLTT